MILNIDFNSEEAIYIQLKTRLLSALPPSAGGWRCAARCGSLQRISVLNMHTVNKAYSVLKQEGFVKLDRRKGAVIALDVDKVIGMQRLAQAMQIILAEAMCKDISRDEVHALVNKIYDYYEGSDCCSD